MLRRWKSIEAQRSAMAPVRLLVVEGNTAEARARQVRFGGEIASEGYARLLRELSPGATVDICYAADPGADLPASGGLASYDGIAITGSSLNIYDGGPYISGQISLIRAAFETGVPIFGSCWGLQLLTVAAGGVVRRNPKGREVGFGRRIRLTSEGREHAMFSDKPDAFEAMTIHLDEVETLPAGSRLLATNDHSKVQAVEIRAGTSSCWAVQYHPEFPFREMAAIFRRISPSLVAEGFFPDEDEEAAFIADLEHLEREPLNKALGWRYGVGEGVLSEGVRTLELLNFITRAVIPFKARRS